MKHAWCVRLLRHCSGNPHWRCVIYATAGSAGDTAWGLSEPTNIQHSQPHSTSQQWMRQQHGWHNVQLNALLRSRRSNSFGKIPGRTSCDPRTRHLQRSSNRLRFQSQSCRRSSDNPSTALSTLSDQGMMRCCAVISQVRPTIRLLTDRRRVTDIFKRLSSRRIVDEWIPANNPSHVARITRKPIA